MKIAMIGQKGIPATYGGVERHVEELSAALAARGHAVTVYSRLHYSRLSGRYRGVRVQPLPSVPTKHLDAITHTLLATAAALVGNYDVIHYHGVGPALFCGAPHLAGSRGVVTVHALDWEREKWGPAARLALRAGAAATRLADAVITVSRSVQVALQRRLGMQATFIPNGVTVLPPTPLDRLARFGLEAGRFVLYLGRFVPEKGCDLLIEAFRRLPLDFKLVMAGDRAGGESFARLQALAAGDERILFPGGLYGRDKAEALSNAAAFVLPSHVEGMAISLLEALAYACPALVSDIPENLEVIRTAGEPLAATFRAGDADDLRRRLEEILLAAPEAHRRADRGVAHVARTYDWSVIAACTEAVYRECGG